MKPLKILDDKTLHTVNRYYRKGENSPEYEAELTLENFRILVQAYNEMAEAVNIICKHNGMIHYTEE